MEFQSTPSARRATFVTNYDYLHELISIHALREEGDVYSFPSSKRTDNFNPRPPRGGRRLFLIKSACSTVFQSTPSARRATDYAEFQGIMGSISIHALREEGDTTLIRPPTRICYFNPRPPRGGRPEAAVRCGNLLGFQSTPSARRATCPEGSEGEPFRISIHALREEGDLGRSRPSPAPRIFQSTPSARRATPFGLPRCHRS